MSHRHTTEQWSEEIRSVVSSFPTDLATVGAYLIVAVLLLEFLTLVPPLRGILAAPLLLFVPGYALVAAAYPRCNDCDRGIALDQPGTIADTDTGLHVVERVLLSVGVSVALLPILGVVTWAAVGRFSTEIVLVMLSAFTLGVIAVSAFRRNNLDPDERFCIRPMRGIRRFRGWLVGPSIRESAVNSLLVGGIVLAVVTMAVAFSVPVTGESYTSAMLGTEQDGEFVAGDYPTTFTVGETESLTLVLGNHEGKTTSYTVVRSIERIDSSDGGLTVVDRTELDRSTLRLGSGETVREAYDVTPRVSGEDLRLSYYIYRGEAPDTPSDESAYRDLHLWIEVDS